MTFKKLIVAACCFGLWLGFGDVTCYAEDALASTYCAGVDLSYVAEVAPEYMENHPEFALNDYDRTLLKNIGHHEAYNQGVVGIAHVMRVVLNRVADDSFPDSIQEVLLQPQQFTPDVVYGYWYEDSDGRVDKALEMIENGWDETNGALYFESGCSWHKQNLQFLYQYKDHCFYKNW